MSVGTWGAYYASSPLLAGNVNASHLAYGSGDLHPLNNANRANALSVRCVQHLCGAVLPNYLTIPYERKTFD